MTQISFSTWCLEASIIEVLGNAQLVSVCCVAMKVSPLHYGQVAPAAGDSTGMECVTDPAVIGHLHTTGKSSPDVSWTYSRALTAPHAEFDAKTCYCLPTLPSGICQRNRSKGN